MDSQEKHIFNRVGGEGDPLWETTNSLLKEMIETKANNDRNRRTMVPGKYLSSLPYHAKVDDTTMTPSLDKVGF